MSFYLADAQNNFEVDLSSGWMFYDLIHDKNDSDNAFGGYGAHSEIHLSYYKSIAKKVTGKIGIGYANNYLLNSKSFGLNQDVPTTSYASLRLSAFYTPEGKRLSYSFGFSNYFLLHKEKQDRNEFQRRIYSNIDLGFMIKMSNHWNFHLNTPITIAPMYKNDNEWGYSSIDTGPEIRPVNVWVETIGLRLGFGYNF